MVLKQRSLPSHVIQSPASEEQAGSAAPRRRVPPPPPPPPPPPLRPSVAASCARTIKPVYNRAHSTNSVASAIRSVVTAAPGTKPSSFAPVVVPIRTTCASTTTSTTTETETTGGSSDSAMMMRRRSTTILSGGGAQGGVVRQSAVKPLRVQDRSSSMPATTAPAPAPAPVAEPSRALSPSFFGNGDERQPFSPKSKVFFGNTDKSARAATTKPGSPTPQGWLQSSWTYVVVGVALYFVISSSTQLRQRNWELRQLRMDYHNMEMALHESDNKLADAEKNVEQLEKQLTIMEKRTFYIQQEVRSKGADSISLDWFTYEGWKLPSTVQEEMTKKLIRRETALQENVERLKKHIQKISHREAVERFGPGPYRVKFRVAFPEENKLYDFVVELAPIDVMPHSVHHFLQMVAHELWDGTIFLHGARHVLQTSNNHSGQAKRESFEKAELTQLSFQEYSDEYPHEKYTLGFGGRPAGPEFYISTADNSVNHGPGGQRIHALHEEADPCFGRVVENTHVIDKMQQRSLQLKENEGTVTAIVDVRIL